MIHAVHRMYLHFIVQYLHFAGSLSCGSNSAVNLPSIDLKMFFEKVFQQKIKNYWLRCNIQYTVIGVIIGTALNIIFYVMNRKFGVDGLIMTYVVSIIITLCITNISLISHLIIRKRFGSPVINVLLNYLLMIAGVTIGTMISIGVFMILYSRPLSDINVWGNLQFNLLVGFIAGSVIYLYQLQRDNYSMQLQEQQLQLSKLNELKTQAELKTLQARINPHFLYNALNSIASLIHEDAARAETMTLQLSQLFRYTLNKQDANFIPVSEEINIARTYLEIEKVRFGERINFNVEADAAIMNDMIPRFLLQPLVENALKHGLKDCTENGRLDVKLADLGDRIGITVSDNGSAFPDELITGYGLQSTYDKLALLYGENYKLTINNHPKQVVIELPKKQ